MEQRQCDTLCVAIIIVSCMSHTVSCSQHKYSRTTYTTGSMTVGVKNNNIIVFK